MRGLSFRYEEAKKLVEQFPHLSKRQLGFLLFKRHPLLYSNKEDALWCVRMVINKNDKWKTTARIDKQHKTDKWIGSN